MVFGKNRNIIDMIWSMGCLNIKIEIQVNIFGYLIDVMKERWVYSKFADDIERNLISYETINEF